jgi:hypothetical protein
VYKTKKEAVDALKKGKLQIFCSSKEEADSICAYIPDAKNNYIDGHYLWKADRCFNFSDKSNYRNLLTAQDFLSLPDDVDNREIEGYYAPFDMYGVQIKSGAIFTTDETYENCFSTSYDNGTKVKRVALPAEIVTKWQPKYKETEADIWHELFKSWNTMKLNTEELLTKFTITRK